MKKVLIIIAIAFVGAVLTSSADVVWSEDFEGASIGATNIGANTILPGTEIYSKNAAGGFLEVVATPAGFTGNTSAQVVQLTATDNNFEAITPGENGAVVGLGKSFAASDTYTISFDFYLLNDSPGLNVGEVQHRWRLDGAGNNVEDPNDSAITLAGVYHVEYTGLISEVSDQTAVNGIAHFLRVWDTATTTGEVIGYMDNINMEVVPEPATLGLIALFGGGIMFIRRRMTL